MTVLVLGLAHMERTGVFWFKGMLPAFLLCCLFSGIGAWLERTAHPDTEEKNVHKFPDYVKCHTVQALLTGIDTVIITTAFAFLFRILPSPCPYGLYLTAIALCFLSLGFLARLVFPYFKDRWSHGEGLTDLLLVIVPLLLIILPFLCAILWKR